MYIVLARERKKNIRKRKIIIIMVSLTLIVTIVLSGCIDSGTRILIMYTQNNKTTDIFI